ncbi:MAG: Type I Iterative PKS [Cirrosporium novae-zelandiae]|nr:MAG: Type I Iterative PKS [Cirrosporium novae-zelandiae]
MAGSVEVFLFGDQTSIFDTGLRQLFQVKGNALLTSFFERVYYILRSEVGRLSAAEREQFPRFTSIVDLLARYRESNTSNPAIESALTSTHQLATFINFYGDGSRPYPSSTEAFLVGSCTGMLAASAVSSSQSAVELLPAAIRAIVVAFRAGLRVAEARDIVQRKSKALPPSRRPYISAASTSGLTISGPNEVLDELLQSSFLKDHKYLRVPIYGPYHAPHLYTESDIDKILGDNSSDDLSLHIPRIPVISSASGDQILAPTYQSLLRAALGEILMEPLRFDKVLEGCKSIVQSSGFTHCSIVPVGQANGAQSLATTMKNASVDAAVDNKLTHGAKTENVPPTGRPAQSKIAIIGLSGRFPSASDPEAFWELLYQGLDVHKEVPPERFDVKTHVDPTGKKKNTTSTPYGCWVDNPGLFDPRFFNMSPREATQTDPMQRLAILTAYEALEQAGFVPNRTPSTQRDRVGIFYGQVSDDWREINSGQNVDTYFIPGGIRAFTPGRINYHFKFSGPSINVDTACSSSLAAIHMACNSLWQGDCDSVIAGGTNILTNPDIFAGLDRGHFLSRTGNCKTFDDGADGYCRADGVGTIVMKRLEDAQADNDPILGVIVGAATNHSAESVSITRPHAGAQSFLFDKVLEAAGIDPMEIGYIEMHGTGTQAGDAVEMRSVLNVFSPDDRKRKAEQALHLGSAKANVGHGESASGIIALIKVLKMMEKNMIPPHCGIKTKINHGFPSDLDERNIRIAFKPTPWNRPNGDGKRKVFVNNFSAAGGNTALLIEDAPLHTKVEGTDPRSTHVVSISAKSKESLKRNMQSLISHLKENQDISLPELSYTTTARRLHHNYRVSVTGSDLQKIIEGLESALEKGTGTTPIPSVLPKTAFAFTGQGSHYAAMGKQFYENFSQFRSDLQHFDSIAQNQGFPSILPLIDGSVEEFKDFTPLVVQLGATCMQMALSRLWKSWGITPTVVIGHSLGEYAALYVAGVLSASDAIFLCAKRAKLLQDHCTAGTHAMLAVQGSVPAIGTHLTGKDCEIACINGPEATVISGMNHNIDLLAEDLKAAGFKSTKLHVPFAFHSAQVEPILHDFENAARGVTFNAPEIPVISPLLREVLTDASQFGPSYMSRHCREAVNFLGGLEAAQEAKLINEKTAWIEIGSHPICSGMVKSLLGAKITAVPSLRRNEDAWKVIANTLSNLHNIGVEINFNDYHRDFKSCHEVIKLPAYNWELKNFWIQYVNDWTLTKGDPVAPTVAAIAAPPPPPVSKISTTTVQRIVEESSNGNTAMVVMESDLAEPALQAAIQGHQVNGTPLCPSSVYGDMAVVLGQYLLDEFNPNAKNKGIDVADIEIGKSLIATGKRQLVRATATADWEAQEAKISIYSVNLEGKKTVLHCNCTVKYGNPEAWKKEWQRTAYLVRSRITALKKGVTDGSSHMIKRGMAYKLFGAIVTYNKKYHGMEEVCLDSEELECTAKVTFQATGKEGNFAFPPYWSDSLGSVSGFVMNANDAVDSKSQVFINHGWTSLRHTKPTEYSADKVYQSYVKMQLVEGTLYAGDVYVFEGDEVIALFEGVRFQGVPRKVLDLVLPHPDSKGAAKSAPAPAAKPSVAKASTAAPKAQKSATKSAPAPVAPKKAASSGNSTKAIAITAEEVGVEVAELTEASAFADLGVDSLLALTITGRFREELDLDMDIDSNIFVDYPTVKDLKNFFSLHEPAEEISRGSVVSLDTSSGMSTPVESGSDFADDESATSIEEDEGDVMNTIRTIIAEEIGVTPSEITGGTNLADFGMDSLMGLTILGRMRESIDLEIPGELFQENETLDAVQSALGIKPNKPKSAPAPKPAKEQKVIAPQSQPIALPPATSILLQGNPKTATKKLFLWPDGSGSSTSYSSIPKVSSNVVVFGLNCPFMKTPEAFNCTLQTVMTSYLAEVRRRQPKGPYYIGGWSAGGVCALEAAKQLQEQGDKVERLIILDAPYPVGIERLPDRLIHFFDSLNLFGADPSKKAPEWLVPHFLSTITALDKYKDQAARFDPTTAPKTYMFWARDGICKYPDSRRPEPHPNEPKTMLWLLNNRTDFGSNGWDYLLGAQNIETDSVENANHFTMMMGEGAAKLSKLIAKAMA